jgi:MOSC domain-containing protein YiiM
MRPERRLVVLVVLLGGTVRPSDQVGAVIVERTRSADEEPPTIVSIHLAPATRLPMRAVASAEVEAGKGLVGDRYHGTRHRHVTLQSAADLAEASAELGSPIDPADTRRNITISHGTIPTKPRSRVRIGDVELEVVRIAAPCKLLDDGIVPGARHALRRRAGTVFRTLSGGVLSVGDEVDLGDEG